MLANATNIKNLSTLLPGLVAKIKALPQFLVGAVGVAGTALGLSQFARDNKEEIEGTATQIIVDNGPSKGTTQLDEIGVEFEGGDIPKSQQRSLVSRLFADDDGSLNWSFITSTAGAATLIALFYVMLKNDDFVKLAGDRLSGLLSILGLESLAKSVDSWGENESSTQPEGVVVSGISSKQKNNFKELEIDLKILSTVFGRRDDQNVNMLRRLFRMNVEELQSYVELKRSITSAER